MKTTQKKLLAFVVAIMLTGCAEQPTDDSYEQKVMRVKELASKISQDVSGQLRAAPTIQPMRIQLSQSSLMENAMQTLAAQGFDPGLAPQIPSDVQLQTVVSENVIRYVDKLSDVGERLSQNLPDDVPNGRVAYVEDITSELSAAFYEVEYEIMVDPYLTENEKLNLTLSLSVVQGVMPAIVETYSYQLSQYYSDGYAVAISRTQGWLKNLFKTIVNATITIVHYTATFAVYGAVIGAGITGGLDGGAVGGVVGAVVGAVTGIVCVADAYIDGANGCFDCVFCVEDWTNDPCYQPTCPW